MTERHDPAQQLARLEARAAITDLIHTYALNIRTGRRDQFAPLFTEDMVFTVRMIDPTGRRPPIERFHHAGRDRVTEFLGRPSSGFTRVVPLIQNVLIDVGDGEASSSSVMSTRSWPSGSETFGEYEDRFRLDDGWRFSARTFSVYMADPA